MAHLNVEIKAICRNPELIRKWLADNRADFIGTDHQTDTYFNTKQGRLKLREGNIENNLIFYDREDRQGPKNSNFTLVKVADAKGLKEVLSKSLGVKIIVQKKREIYFIDNVKFHVDEVPGLGSFVEIEAGNINADISEAKLRQQCNHYLKEFGIKEQELVAVSYSDMLLARVE
jgi:predicted adenylyl cyclase CyaB